MQLSESTLHMATLFGGVSGSILVLLLVTAGRKNKMDSRLAKLGGEDALPEGAESLARLAQKALPSMGTALMPEDEEKRSQLQTRLVRAGLYSRQALPMFLGVKLLLILVPLVLGVLAALANLIPSKLALPAAAMLGIVGMIGPGWWLDRRKARRQSALRRALPDALDVLVICLEGGLSLSGSLRRVSGELDTSHPLLADEFKIVQREVQYGLTIDVSLRRFADRVDIDEIRSLASLVGQTERFGASLAGVLRIHAETSRQKRLLEAEEAAHKAATQMLLPTILCIFPGVFIVVLAPAIFHMITLFKGLKH